MNDCIEWQGNRHDKGYGRQWSAELNRYERATHIVLRDEGIDVPSGMCVMHTCDNPPCVNPDHLQIGTHADNMADMAKKGRGTPKITAADVIEIREHSHAFPQQEVADYYGITRAAVYKIVTHKTWSHL